MAPEPGAKATQRGAGATWPERQRPSTEARVEIGVVCAAVAESRPGVFGAWVGGVMTNSATVAPGGGHA